MYFSMRLIEKVVRLLTASVCVDAASRPQSAWPVGCSGAAPKLENTRCRRNFMVLIYDSDRTEQFKLMTNAAKKPYPTIRKKAAGVAETKLPTFSESLMLVRKGKKPKPEILKPKEIAGTLVAETLDALSSPGLAHSVVFRGLKAAQVSSYSILPADPTKVVREQADGTRTVGRLVGGRFRALPTSKPNR